MATSGPSPSNGPPTVATLQTLKVRPRGYDGDRVPVGQQAGSRTTTNTGVKRPDQQ
jgi:hypothetical protein